ncbi:MAG TPA: alpha/beta fold hydrolase [Anaeromyxobacteraceae bacterium]|jgi:pimeloyl-ACP methyl ester carboxylesterase
MRSVLIGLEKLRRQLRYLAGYFHLEEAGPAARSADFGRARRPVLLLHGFLSSRRAVAVLERRLRREGYTVFTLNFGGPRQLFRKGVDDLADFLRTKVERLYARHPRMGPLTIVGHSQGGLVGAWYVKKLGGWRRARALITLGTPHRGAPLAVAALPLAPLAPALWQMRPGSGFLESLRRGAWPPGVRLVSVWSRADLLSTWPSPVVESGGLPYVRNVEVKGVRHREFLFKRRVHQALLDELRSGEEAALVPLTRHAG